MHTAVKTFTFQEALNWLAHQDIKQPLQQPQEQLQALQLMQLVTVIQPAGASIQQIQSKHGRQGLLRLSADVPWACPGQPLNGHFSWHGKARAAAEVGTAFAALFLSDEQATCVQQQKEALNKVPSLQDGCTVGQCTRRLFLAILRLRFKMQVHDANVSNHVAPGHAMCMTPCCPHCFVKMLVYASDLKACCSISSPAKRGL